MNLFKKLGNGAYFFLFFGIVLAFFYKYFFFGLVPFPGDILVSHYNPYKSYPFLGYEPGSYPHKAQNIDVVEQLYPWKHFSITSLKSGEFPLWNPYNFSGTPHLASIQSGTFYPLNALFFLLPFLTAWSLFIIFQPLLAGTFTYLFLRELKLSSQASVLGGITFAFSSFLVVWMQYGNMVHALVWMSFVLWLMIRYFASPTVLKAVGISAALSFSIFAGHFQISLYLYLYTFLFGIILLFFRYRDTFFSKVLQLTGVYSLSLLLASVQIFPSLEIFLNSSRTDYTYSRLVEFLIPLHHVVSIIFPDFFGNPVSRNYWVDGTYIERVTYFGIIPFFFALYAVISKRTYYVWFSMITIVVVFFITFDNFITRFLYSLYIPPIIGTSVPTRIIFLLTFSGSILSAFGYDEFIKNKSLKKFLITLGVFGTIVTSLWVFVLGSKLLLEDPGLLEKMAVSLRSMIVPTGVLFLALPLFFLYLLQNHTLVKKRKKIIQKIFFFCILSLTAIELFYFFQKFTPFSPKESIYPQTSVMTFIKENQGIFRTWGYGSASIRPNIETYEHIYSTDGYDPFYIRNYGELLSSTGEGRIPTDIKRANAHLAEGFGEENLRENMYRQRIMNMLGVKYVIHNKPQDNHAFDKTFNEEIYELVFNDRDLQIYENTAVLPRAYLVSEYRVLDEEDTIDTLYSNEFELRNAVILQEDIQMSIPKSGTLGDVSIERYSPNRVSLRTESRDNSILVLTDSYYPGWRAYVDGQESRIYKANFAIRAVAVPSGTHSVEFRYEPMLFSVGLRTTIFSYAFVSVVVITALVRKRLV